MDNYVVHPEHINVMLWAGMQIGMHRGSPVQWKENPADNTSAVTDILEIPLVNYVGQMLLDTNRAAVGEPEYLVYAYRTPIHTTWSLLEVLNTIGCYEHRCRVMKDWPLTEAHAFCRALERAVLREMVALLPNAGRTPVYHLTDQSTPSTDEDISCFPVPTTQL